MLTHAIKELMYKMADDQLIYGHRNSEWIGLGPLLEEDIAFASMAQDKVGQARMLYNALSGMGEADADTLAFMRGASDYRCCHLVELPAQTYELALVRHFLFDEAEAVRFALLRESTDTSLAAYARKFGGEIKYHTLHGRAILKRLCQSTDEARARIEAALQELSPYCSGIFEGGPYEEELIANAVFAGEAAAGGRWLEAIGPILTELDLPLPTLDGQVEMGGRSGNHSPYLEQVLEEMSEVFKLDPGAEW